VPGGNGVVLMEEPSYVPVMAVIVKGDVVPVTVSVPLPVSPAVSPLNDQSKMRSALASPGVSETTKASAAAPIAVVRNIENIVTP
jgi:hypothetical protein